MLNAKTNNLIFQYFKQYLDNKHKKETSTKKFLNCRNPLVYYVKFTLNDTTALPL